MSSLKALMSASRSRHWVRFASALRPCKALLQENDKVVGVLLTGAFAAEPSLGPTVFAFAVGGLVVAGVAPVLVFAVAATLDAGIWASAPGGMGMVLTRTVARRSVQRMERVMVRSSITWVEAI